MKLMKRLWYLGVWLGLTLAFGFVTVCLAVYLYLAPGLPPVEEIRNVELQIPLRVYASDGQLLSEIGEQRRTPIAFSEIPELYVKALLAIEDHRFELHPGVDPLRFASAAVSYVLHGPGGAGGSTLTQQVARSFFLNPEKTFTRKFGEIILSLQMERLLSKQEIFELYSNKMFLGHRAYGIQAAAQVYYGRDVQELTLAELATLAGLHQRPSAANPLSFPERAMERRNMVLRRMHELAFISSTEYEQARQAPNTAQRNTERIAVSAPYVAEEARKEVLERFGEDAINAGYRVYTSIDPTQQQAARTALIDKLLDYSERHGYLGPEDQVELESGVLPPAAEGTLDPEALSAEDKEYLDQIIAEYGYFGELEPALVLAVIDGSAATQEASAESDNAQAPRVLVWARFSGLLSIPLEELTWARERLDIDRFGPKIEQPSQVLAQGDIIRVRRNQEDSAWRLAQIPEAQAAYVALAPQDGAVRAMVGGFDYFLSSFNRVLQAERQPGSNFKPFVYAAALDAGMSPATLVNDAPIVMEDSTLEDVWRPRNSGDRYLGYIPMRQALYRSINVASVRVLQEIGVEYAADYVTRFGFAAEDIPHNLGMVLGNATFSPMAIARAFAVFANGGFLVEPYLIDRIEDLNGNIVYEPQRRVACDDCSRVRGTQAPRALSPQTQYLMTDILRDTVQRGTARGALALGRDDLAGKTGTTNDATDAWFTGFNPDLVGTAWVGRDDNTTLGFNEFGSRAALPIWIDTMEVALAGVPERGWAQPAGISQVRIDPKTGHLAPPGYPDARFELYRSDLVPKERVDVPDDFSGDNNSGGSQNNSGSGGPLF